LKAMGQEKYKYGFDIVKEYPAALEVPYTWKSSKMVFVNSMSDLFHKEISSTYIKKVFDVMNENPQHVFQVLTKRSERLFELNGELNWTHNIWMGVSVENDKVLNRIDNLKKIGAKVKFLSLEPLIGPLLKLDLKNLDWVIVGGESGPNARPIKKQWVLNIKNQCELENVAFFFKQWGGVNKKVAGRLLDGRTYDEIPIIVEVGRND
jgi:protein gp37